MHLVMSAVGWKDLTSGSLMMIAFTGGGTLMIVAYLMDVLMERFSFGIIMNWLLLFFGGLLGLVALHWYGWPPNRKEFVHALLFCSVSAVTLLVAAASLKRAV